MLRIVLMYGVPLLAPTLVFLAWVWLRARYVERHGGEAPGIEKGTWFWLAASGMFLMLLTMGITALLEPGGTPDQVYQPPTVVDGKVVPGQFRPVPVQPAGRP